jgi:hypothetical protein
MLGGLVWNCARPEAAAVVFPREIERSAAERAGEGSSDGNGKNRLESMMGNIGASSLFDSVSGAKGSPPSIHHCP